MVDKKRAITYLPPQERNLMKKKSKTAVYSDCECPHCSRDVSYDVVYQRFFNLACSVTEFEIPCTHCWKPIQVFVEPIPAFTFNKAVEHVNEEDKEGRGGDPHETAED
jgi:hypothetical protein